MELKAQTRSPKKKSDIKQLRAQGKIPAILYSKGDIGEALVVDAIPFKKIINQLKPGSLSATIFDLTFEGKVVKAIVKDIQYNIITYDVIHLDFVELIDDVPVTLNIPIECINAVDCVGVKLGGVLRQVVGHLKVRCLPKDIPSHFELDVKDVGMFGKRRLSDISLPNTVEPRMGLNTIAVVIGKK